MSRLKKVAVIAAIALIVIGGVMAVAALAILDFDFTKLTTESEAIEQLYVVSDTFHSIAVDTDTDDIRFVLSEDGTCRVQYHETDKLTYTVAVQNDCLTVNLVDHRRWYDHIGIFLHDETNVLTIYLPKAAYALLTVEADTSMVDMASDLSFERVTVETDTGDVVWRAAVTDTLSLSSDTGHLLVDAVEVGSLSLETDTGEVDVQATTVNGHCAIETDTGYMNLVDVSCATLQAQSSTGCVTLTDTVADGTLVIESDTGDVALENVDAASLRICTSTGDVTGTLLTDKIFFTETATGRVDVPHTTTGGMCEVTTSTGDIMLGIV